LECIDATIPVEWGVSHSTDVPIWFWRTYYSKSLTHQEKICLKGWNEGFAAFVHGETDNWETHTPLEMRRWRGDGETDIWEDERWQEGVDVWKLVNDDAQNASTWTTEHPEGYWHLQTKSELEESPA
jgi:hypothetical protein